MANFRHKRNHWLGVDFPLFSSKKLTFAKKKKRKEYSTPSAPTYTYYHSTIGFWGGLGGGGGGGGFQLGFVCLVGLFSNFALSKIWRIFPQK